MTRKIKIFLASSSELREDREQFEIFINRKNKDLIDQEIFLELVLWEDFFDSISKTRLQDEYNKAAEHCNIFIMLFFTKVGQYTLEEFESAFQKFKKDDKPLIYTYFKNANIATGEITNDIVSMIAFKEKLMELGHFTSQYDTISDLKLKVDSQLNKYVQSISIKKNQVISDPSLGLDRVTKSILYPINSNLKIATTLWLQSNDIFLTETINRIKERIKHNNQKKIQIAQSTKVGPLLVKTTFVDTMHFLNNEDMPRHDVALESEFYFFLKYLWFDFLLYKRADFDLDYFLKYLKKVGRIIPPDLSFALPMDFYVDKPKEGGNSEEKNNQFRKGQINYFEKRGEFRLESAQNDPQNLKVRDTITSIYDIINSHIILVASIQRPFSIVPIIPQTDGSFVQVKTQSRIVDLNLDSLALTYPNGKEIVLNSFSKTVKGAVIYFYGQIHDWVAW